MAKQISMIKFTGKLGEMVGQKDAYGKAIIRQRVESPKNPKTTAQAGQRYKLLPAQRIASALKEIIERGQQGVKYGLESRNLFIKRALKMTTGFPYMEKDDPNTIPGEYQLTKGTLPEVKCTIAAADDFFVTTLGAEGIKDFGDDANMGDFSALLLSENSFLQEGDQITFVIFESDDNAIITSKYRSMIIDSESVAEIDNFVSVNLSQNDAGKLTIFGNPGDIIAAAVIISRPNGANGYLRSNATLAVDKTNTVISKYFTAVGNDAALKTYEGDTSISNNTNWPVDIDGDGGSGGGSGFVTISADADDPIPEGSTLTGLGRYAVGDTVTLQYNQGTSSTSFKNWVVGGNDMPALDDNPWTFTAQRNMTVSVNGTSITPP